MSLLKKAYAAGGPLVTMLPQQAPLTKRGRGAGTVYTT